MIKAIIFDCFGVLTSEGWQNFKLQYFKDKEPEKLEEATKLIGLADKGEMNHEQLIPLLAELANVPLSVVRTALETHSANIVLLEYINDNLKSKYKIGMLSNISDDWLHRLFTAEQLTPFEAFALSYQMGYAKPDKRAYKYIAEKLGVKMYECIFLDDSSFFVDEATRFGMTGIHYENYTQAITELESVLKMSDTDK